MDATARRIEEGEEHDLGHLPNNGWPMVTVHIYCVIDGEIRATSANEPREVDTFRRDDRTCVCISNGDVTVNEARAVWIAAHARVVEAHDFVAEVRRARADRYFQSQEARQTAFEEPFLRTWIGRTREPPARSADSLSVSPVS
ncbi:MAG: hypothetical protein HY899_19070 [Deltaproteobacteria bacterium]|nr:hypothetical protein [Deltaproteobacteria bacterium]